MIVLIIWTICIFLKKRCVALCLLPCWKPSRHVGWATPLPLSTPPIQLPGASPSRPGRMGFLHILIPNFQHSCNGVESRVDFGTRASLESSHQRSNSKCSGAVVISPPGDEAVAAALRRPSISANRCSWSGQAQLDDWNLLFFRWILPSKEMWLIYYVTPKRIQK